MMKKIEKLDERDDGSSRLTDKINELIELVNSQQKEIASLKQQLANVDGRTSQFQRVGVRLD